MSRTSIIAASLAVWMFPTAAMTVAIVAAIAAVAFACGIVAAKGEIET